MQIKLIYVSFIRLTDKVARDWYIDHSIENGAIVEYWDIVSLVRDEYDETGSFSPSYLRYIKNYKEFEALLCLPENKGAIYVMLVSYSARTSKPFRLLSKYNCKLVFISWGAMPATPPTPRLQRLIGRLFKSPVWFVRTMASVIIAAAYRRLKNVKRYDIVFAAGQTLSSIDQYAAKVVPINLCDYDHYKRVDASDRRLTQGKYAVFLDINLPRQSDLGICGLAVVNAASYYQSLNRFFGLIEQAHGVKVVIAAHPKANYDNEVFEQREVYRLLTAELVKDAEFVITHTSTALSYAVLNIKPTVFVYTDEMERVYENNVIQEIESLAKYLNANVYNVDKISDGSQLVIKMPDRARYDAYKYSFLTSSESENLLSSEIFWREVNAI